MKMCDEMIKLRAELDKRGIKWEDKSSILPQEAIQMMIEQGIDERYADASMFRTHFNVGGHFYSVINGYGSYGGYDPLSGKNKGLLECMKDDNEPVGELSFSDVLRLIEEE